MSELGPDIIEEARLRYIAAVEAGEIDPAEDVPEHIDQGQITGFSGYLFIDEDLEGGELTDELAEALLEVFLAERALEDPEAFERDDGMCPGCGGQHAELN